MSVQTEIISTHAPAGGATKKFAKRKQRRIYFYSRPCGRGDYSGINGLLRGHIFLLTPLREGRRQRLGRSLMNL